MGNFISRKTGQRDAPAVEGSASHISNPPGPVALPDGEVTPPDSQEPFQPVGRTGIRLRDDATKPDVNLSRMLAVQDMAEERKKLDRPSGVAKLFKKKPAKKKSKR